MANNQLELGQLMATPGVLGLIDENRAEIAKCIERHARHDWGEVSADDAKANDQALVDETRVLSAYTLSTGEKIWIITEADRSATTIMLPEEY